MDKLVRYVLYETRRDFWIVGETVTKDEWRVLQLHLDVHNQRFIVTEYPQRFTKPQIDEWIQQRREIAKRDEDDEFRQKAPVAWGLLGLIRFTSCYYICLVTKCSIVALLGGNRIYHIDETKLVPLVHSSRHEVPDRRSAEARLASTFHSLDLAKTFYFSPTYDLTNTLQTNIGHVPASSAASMFVWNSHLLTPMTEVQIEDGSDPASKQVNEEMQDDDEPQVNSIIPDGDPTGVSPSEDPTEDHLITTNSGGAAIMTLSARKRWFLEIIHGFIDQARISVFGNSVYITLIARRSHQFAGARFYKRGVNNQGYPANEVETEQIVSNQLDSHFSDRYTSYVQHRGSICVSWSQMSNNMSPQPPIRIDAMDPYYEAAAKHFNRMFSRYGYPIRVLNLVKTREKRPREGLLATEFENCISYLSQFLPQDRTTITDELQTRSRGLDRVANLQTNVDRRHSGNHGLMLKGGVIEYTHWDMSRAAKSKSSEVMDYLGKYANKTLRSTSIFQANKSIQQGVCRTNCIDCLDRTNAAQSVIAKHALGYQLHALGITDKPKVDYDTDIMDLLTEMYHDHGDTLALQYGGSNLVNTVETYRRINQWSSHSRDLIESIRRFYSNSFMDAQRQDAINVFLGNYQYSEGTNLWDLSTDYYLHNSAQHKGLKPSYRQWYEPHYLRPPLPNAAELKPTVLQKTAILEDHGFTSLSQMFMSKINSTDKYSTQLSPFEIHDKRSKRQSALKHSSPEGAANPAHVDPSGLVVDELELFYSRYLTSATALANDEQNLEIAKEYERILQPPIEPLGSYQPIETPWDS